MGFFNKVLEKRKEENFAQTLKTVEKIHNEFDTAADKALEEALNILSTLPKVNEEKSELLNKLGFTGVKEHVQVYEVKSITHKNTERAKIVEKYKKLYPNNKFIFKDQITTICAKYGLVAGEVGRYIGNVPDKNLQEIAEFKAREEDTYYFISGRDGIWADRPDVLNKIDKEKDDEDRINSQYSWSRPSYFKIPLYICAPKADMNMENARLVDGKIIKNEIPDPIVLHYVKDGFLILSKWGPEANIKEIQ